MNADIVVGWTLLGSALLCVLVAWAFTLGEQRAEDSMRDAFEHGMEIGRLRALAERDDVA